MKNLAIARRYAKALILIGQQDGQAEAYREELAGVATVIQDNDGLRQTIGNPLYDRAARRDLLQTVVDKLGVSRVMRSFLMLLFDKGRIGGIQEIERAYQKLADDLKNVSRASITSATALSEEAVISIREALGRMTGRDVVLEVSEDPGLIGGVVTRIGDLVYDGSVRTQLQNLRESFKRGEGI